MTLPDPKVSCNRATLSFVFDFFCEDTLKDVETALVNSSVKVAEAFFSAPLASGGVEGVETSCPMVQLPIALLGLLVIAAGVGGCWVIRGRGKG